MITIRQKTKRLLYKRFLIIFLGIFLLVTPIASASTDNIHYVNYSSALNIDVKQVDCLTKALYWEVRQPSQIEMDLVASVIITRTYHDNYPSNVCEVVLERGQFEYVSKGLHNTNKTIKSSNKNPTEKRAFYLARKTAIEFISGYKQPLIKSIAYISNKIKKPKSKFWNKLSLEKKSELHSFYVSEKKD